MTQCRRIFVHGFFLFIIFSLFSQTHTFAAKTITRGDSATINWNVTGAPNCRGDTDYDGSAGEVASWKGVTMTSNTGSIVFPKLSGGSTFPKTYTFTCTYGGISDSDTLTINDCSGGKIWNGTACVTPPSPTGTLSATPLTCTIASGASTCNSAFTWTTANVTSPDVYNITRGVQYSTSGSGTSVSYAVTNGANTVRLRDVTTTILATVTVTGSCASGNSWNGTSCQPLSGSFNPVPPSCTIASGASTCNTSLTWSTTNSTTTVSIRRNGTQIYTGTSGSGQPASVPYGNNSVTFTIYTGGLTLDTKQASGTCVAGTTWNGSTCQPPSGSITSSASTCAILSGNSTCTTNLTWSTTLPIGTSVVFNGTSNIYTVNNGTSQPATVPHGSITFTLRNNGTDLDSVSVTGSCAAGTVWNGGLGKCVDFCLNGGDNPPDCDHGNIMSGTIGAAPISCLIATGASTCVTHLNWTTVNPVSYSAVTRDGTPGELYKGPPNTAADQVTNVPFEADGTVIYRLYNNTLELDSTSVGVGCASGGPEKWDTDNNVCADPIVISVKVNGMYYNNPGSIEFVCSNSDSYSLIRDLSGANEVISSGTYTTKKTVPVTISDNYTVFCKHGSVSSAPSTVRYDSPPPPSPVIFINATPKTMDFQGKSAVNWVIQFPEIACSLKAKPVCTNDVCSQAQTDAAAVLNNTIATENTDTNDQGNGNGGTRAIQTAINTIAPGHEETDWKALGKKTFTVTKSTDFTIDCGGGNTATTRVRITNSNEE